VTLSVTGGDAIVAGFYNNPFLWTDASLNTIGNASDTQANTFILREVGGSGSNLNIRFVTAIAKSTGSDTITVGSTPNTGTDNCMFVSTWGGVGRFLSVQCNAPIRPSFCSSLPISSPVSWTFNTVNSNAVIVTFNSPGNPSTCGGFITPNAGMTTINNSTDHWSNPEDMEYLSAPSVGSYSVGFGWNASCGSIQAYSEGLELDPPVVVNLCTVGTNGVIIGAGGLLIAMVALGATIVQQSGNISPQQLRRRLDVIFAISIAIIVVAAILQTTSAGGPC